jgi:hypothetical protein
MLPKAMLAQCFHPDISVRTVSLDGFVNQSTCGAVHVQHVEVDAPNLRVEIASYRRAGGDIGLHDVPNDLDGFAILE